MFIMDVRSYIRPIITGLVGLGVIVLLIVLFIRILTGGPSAPSTQVDVSKYADTPAVATLLIDTPTNIDQDHRQVRITVSGTTNEIDILQGYEGNVMASQTYPNNSVAFGVFLKSIQLLNFSKGTTGSGDYQGYCPTGYRYVYTFNDGNTDLFKYWNTSCGGQGTFKGNGPTIRELFVRQIPEQDYDQLTNDIPLTL